MTPLAKVAIGVGVIGALLTVWLVWRDMNADDGSLRGKSLPMPRKCPCK